MSKIKKALLDGIAKIKEQGDIEERKKVGTLRGGNSGIYIKEEDMVAGKCQRLSYLRMKGITASPPEANRSYMFQGGLSNEDIWYDILSRSWEGKILREEEVATKWETESGVPVTGRPDIVLCDKDGSPELGIELKLVSSIWTARDVLFEGRPKFDHLVQAAHYSWQLNIPFELWYTNRVDFATNDMVTRLLPRIGEPGSEHVQYAYYHRRPGKRKPEKMMKYRATEQEYLDAKARGDRSYVADPLKVLPFAVGYQLFWNTKGNLCYVSVETGKRGETEISRARIKDYYELVATLEERDDLGPRPLTLKGDGSAAGYSNCSYCPLQSVCDANQDNKLSTWMPEVERKLQEIKDGQEK